MLPWNRAYNTAKHSRTDTTARNYRALIRPITTVYSADRKIAAIARHLNVDSRDILPTRTRGTIPTCFYVSVVKLAL